MKRIIKNEPPEEWRKFVKKHPKFQYKDLNKEKNGMELRQLLKSSLIEEQGGLCCYCSRQIEVGENSSHNEHLKSRNDYPNESMNYQNIVASCNSSTTCGKYKDKKSITEEYVSPLEDNCEENFSWNTAGTIFGNNERAKRTIDLLQLNQQSLKESRSALIQQCLDIAKSLYDSEEDGKEYIRLEYIESKNGKKPIFSDMIEWLYNHGDFDSDMV